MLCICHFSKTFWNQIYVKNIVKTVFYFSVRRLSFPPFMYETSCHVSGTKLCGAKSWQPGRITDTRREDCYFIVPYFDGCVKSRQKSTYLYVKCCFLGNNRPLCVPGGYHVLLAQTVIPKTNQWLYKGKPLLITHLMPHSLYWQLLSQRNDLKSVF